jgi:hypothetical protein
VNILETVDLSKGSIATCPKITQSMDKTLIPFKTSKVSF